MSVKGPASRPRPSPDKALSAAPAVHDARLDPRVVLPGPGKVRVHVLDLDQSDGNMLRELIIGPASQSHRKGISTGTDRKSTRLNSSHDQISYAVFCLKKKT